MQSAADKKISSSLVVIDIENVDSSQRTHASLKNPQGWLWLHYVNIPFLTKVVILTLLVVVLGKQYDISNELHNLKSKKSESVSAPFGEVLDGFHRDRMKRQINSISNGFPYAKAVHVVFADPDLYFKHQGGTLGPLYLSDDGEEYGFTDKWNSDIKLANKDHSVLIPKDGLYFLSVQIKYKRINFTTDKLPVGFRVYCRKQTSKTRLPIALTECMMPPMNSSASCSTSTTSQLQRGDEISIVHISPVDVELDTKPASSYFDIVSLP